MRVQRCQGLWHSGGGGLPGEPPPPLHHCLKVLTWHSHRHSRPTACGCLVATSNRALAPCGAAELRTRLLLWRGWGLPGWERRRLQEPLTVTNATCSAVFLLHLPPQMVSERCLPLYLRSLHSCPIEKTFILPLLGSHPTPLSQRREEGEKKAKFAPDQVLHLNHHSGKLLPPHGAQRSPLPSSAVPVAFVPSFFSPWSLGCTTNP